jgi:hypothetical protein
LKGGKLLRYGLVARGGDVESPVLLIRQGERGERELLLFEPPEAGEAFLTLENLRPQWRILAYTEAKLAELLTRAEYEGIEHILINPPDRGRRCAQPARTVEVEEFVEQLRNAHR